MRVTKAIFTCYILIGGFINLNAQNEMLIFTTYHSDDHYSGRLVEATHNDVNSEQLNRNSLPCRNEFMSDTAKVCNDSTRKLRDNLNLKLTNTPGHALPGIQKPIVRAQQPDGPNQLYSAHASTNHYAHAVQMRSSSLKRFIH